MISAIKNIRKVFSINGGGASFAYTPEDVANKSDSYTVSSSTTYASTKALVDGLASVSVTPNVQTVTAAPTIIPTFTNDEVVVTAQSSPLFIGNPTGTPIDGKNLVIRIKDNGTARALSYDTQYRAIGVTLPTTTVINKTIYLGLVYNLTDTKWDVVGVSIEGADPLYDSGWIDYSATSTIVGWISFTTKIIRYRIVGKQMFVQFQLDGTSNSTSLTFTLPSNVLTPMFNNCYAVDNGVANVGICVNSSGGSNIITGYRFSTATSITSTWTALGTKTYKGQFFIEIA